MSADDNVKLVKGVMDALLRGDIEPLLAALTPDAQVKAVIPEGTPLSGDFRGRDGFLRYFQAHAEVMEILDVSDMEFLASESKVVILLDEKFRVKRTGTVCETETATVFTLEQGKIAKLSALADMSAIVDAYRTERES
jgi:ketosteroid isomerase-like protein